MISMVFTRTRDRDFDSDLSQFPDESESEANLAFRAWFSSAGSVALIRRTRSYETTHELWLRTLDPQRKDRMGQRPILCIACLYSSKQSDFAKLSNFFAEIITDSNAIETVCSLLREDAAVAEEPSTGPLESTRVARACIEQPDRNERLGNTTHLESPVNEDHLENRRRMAAMSFQDDSFERLLIGTKLPPPNLRSKKNYVLLPSSESQHANSEVTSEKSLNFLKNKMKDLVGFGLLIGISGVLWYANNQLQRRADDLQQRLVDVEEKMREREPLLDRIQLLENGVARINTAVERNMEPLKKSLNLTSERLDRVERDLRDKKRAGSFQPPAGTRRLDDTAAPEQ